MRLTNAHKSGESDGSVDGACLGMRNRVTVLASWTLIAMQGKQTVNCGEAVGGDNVDIPRVTVSEGISQSPMHRNYGTIQRDLEKKGVKLQ